MDGWPGLNGWPSASVAVGLSGPAPSIVNGRASAGPGAVLNWSRHLPSGLALACVLVLAMLAMLRPLDHDESQYVAAAVLTAHGMLPYRDFAYLQTPLQPFAFAPVAAAAGAWTWPALRLVNALLGAIAIGSVYRAGLNAGADARTAAAAAALFGGCDVLLFSAGTARNDALPAACFALAIVGIVRGDTLTRTQAAAIGLTLATSAAVKISYALPAAAYGLYMLQRSSRDAAWVAVGAAPVAIFVAWTCWLSPAGFLFGTVMFPARAPLEFYADRPWKLSVFAKLLDLLKFSALGAALPAAAIVGGDAWRRRRTGPLDLLILAALVAAALPAPTWRQYLLPVLPPLFVGLAIAMRDRPPARRARAALLLFAAAGLAPPVASVAASAAWRKVPLVDAMRQAAAAGRAMDALGLNGPVVTLSPQLLPAARRLPDARFAAGPFYFRSHDLLGPAEERRLHLLSAKRAASALGEAPVALVGGPPSADRREALLERSLQQAFGGTPVAVPGTDLTLLVRPGTIRQERRVGSRR